jgi:hypothetical protein
LPQCSTDTPSLTANHMCESRRALLGKGARSAGWGVGRSNGANRLAPTLPPTRSPRAACFPNPIRRLRRHPRVKPEGRLFPASRRSWSSSYLPQRRTKALDDDRQSTNDEIVGKSKNAKSRASKPFIPLGVLDLRILRLVRATVRFDDDSSRKTNEIREVGSNRRLPAKAVSIDPMIPHRAPKHGAPPSSCSDAARERTCARTDENAAARPSSPYITGTAHQSSSRQAPPFPSFALRRSHK